MAGRRALVVATYEYADAGLRRLVAPERDAEELAAVLADPEVAGFDVTVLVNEPHHVVGGAIADFYADCRRDDLALLYFSGHGLKDDEGRLYLAMSDTRRDRLLFTGLSAATLSDAMDACPSRRKVLVLDCCYSGAFPAGRTAKADEGVHTLERFQGKGRAVLTATDATQYAFEGDDLTGAGTSSVFTRHLVAAIRTGAADLDEDGDIALDELYSYVRERVVAEMPQQRPKKQEDVDGRIIVARNVNWALPVHLRHAIDSPIAAQRVTAVEGLVHLHRAGNDVVRAAVRERLVALSDDDSRKVSAAAAAVLADLEGTVPPAAPTAPPVVAPEARADVPEEPAPRGTARRNPAPPRPAVPSSPPAARRPRPPAPEAPRPATAPEPVTAASSPGLEIPVEERATRRLRLPVALLEVAVLTLVTTRALVFESTNGYQFSDFGFDLALLVGYLLPLCGAIVLLLLLLGAAASAPPGWYVPAATGLATGAFLCVAVELLRTTVLIAVTSDYGPGPGYWALLAGFVVLAAAGGVLLDRGGLTARPAFAWDTGLIAAPVVLGALVIAMSRVPDDSTDVASWLTNHGPVTLLAALGLVLSVLKVDRGQSLAGLVAITVFGVWLTWFLLIVPPVVVGDSAVVAVGCLVAVVLAADGAQYLRRRRSVRHASVPTGDRR